MAARHITIIEHLLKVCNTKVKRYIFDQGNGLDIRYPNIHVFCQHNQSIVEGLLDINVICTGINEHSVPYDQVENLTAIILTPYYSHGQLTVLGGQHGIC